MKFNFYNPHALELWDYRSVDKGIAGMETHNVEMAWRLAKRGHEVTCYAPIPPDCKREWRGTHWKALHEASFEDEGIWVLVRHAFMLDRFPKKHPKQRIWAIPHLHDCPGLTEENVHKLNKLIALCGDQANRFVECYPYARKKLALSSNGIQIELIREIEQGKIPRRDPLRLMYASSPDRGLDNLLKIFKAAKKEVPGLSLHIFYGFDNIDKLLKRNPKRNRPLLKLKNKLQRLMDQPGVVWHGRTPQKKFILDWLKTGIWCYPCAWPETNCITCMEAQALGAVPITNPFWALKENVKHGVLIKGNPADSIVQKRYVEEVVRMATDLKRQEAIRKKAMADARIRFDWEKVVDQWESWL